jgi:hypothetical protein
MIALPTQRTHACYSRWVLAESTLVLACESAGVGEPVSRRHLGNRNRFLRSHDCMMRELEPKNVSRATFTNWPFIAVGSPMGCPANRRGPIVRLKRAVLPRPTTRRPMRPRLYLRHADRNVRPKAKAQWADPVRRSAIMASRTGPDTERSRALPGKALWAATMSAPEVKTAFAFVFAKSQKGQ